MIRTSEMILALLLSVNFLWAQAISLSGTVTKTGGTAGIQGVSVGLVKMPSLSAITNAQGAFTIIGTASMQSQTPQAARLHYSLIGNSLIISSLLPASTGRVELYSSDGRKIASTPFHGTTTGELRMGLPVFESGLTMLRIITPDETVTRAIVRLGDALYLKNANAAIETHGEFTSTKQTLAAIVDTLIATKMGYSTGKVAIDSYNKQNIAITLDTLTGTCPTLKLPAISAITYSNAKHPGPFDFKYTNLPRVTTKAQWECRRQEIWQMAQDYLYGHLPPKPESVTGTVNNGAISITCKQGSKSQSWTVTTTGSGDILVIDWASGVPAPANSRTCGMNSSTMITYINNLYGSSDVGICMAGAWGVGRIIDVLEQNPNGGISAKKVITTGCSTCGKQALIAGIFEPRVAICMPVESGCAGTCSWRVSSAYGHGNSNTDCQDITHLETNWLGTVAKNTWQTGNPKIDKLPFDQGEVMALRAPGAMMVFDNGMESYKWLCNRGNTAAAQGCHWIYKALGISDNFGFAQPSAGHTHCGFPAELKPHCQAFYDKFLNGKTDANTNIMRFNPASIETSKWFDFGTGKDQWDTTTVLQ
jgi:hypothetical protein